MVEHHKFPGEIKEFLHRIPGNIAGPVPFFVRLLDESKLRAFVKLELDYKIKVLKNTLEITEKMVKLL